MFKPATLRVFAVIAMSLSALGLIINLLLIRQSGTFAFTILSWPLLLWASYIGLKLTSYKLQEDEYKKVGIRIYLIIAGFVFFMIVGGIIALVLAAALLSTLWGMKRNYDEWDGRTPAADEGSDSAAA